MLIYLTIPSAAGLGLLLVSTVYPILVNLGVSKTTSLSVISAATIFDMGPGSANTLRAAEIAGLDNVGYFLGDQLPLVIPTTIVVMVAYFFTNRYFDRKEIAAGKQIYAEKCECVKPDVPLYFAAFPVLPLLFLIIFSPFIGLFDTHITTALVMIICMLLIVVFLVFYKRNFKEGFENAKSFWTGMGNTFSSVVTLIVTAEIFALGLTSLNFIDLLVSGTSSVGLGAIAITVLITFTVFFSATMMGSGNAAFFSFGPMVPGIAAMMGVSTLQMMLPIQLCAGMGRATSPIAAVNVAISGSVGISSMDVAKRNMIPMIAGAIFLTVLSFIINW
jgi:c4-dicarboxylate anaerobic carrier family protein